MNIIPFVGPTIGMGAGCLVNTFKKNSKQKLGILQPISTACETWWIEKRRIVSSICFPLGPLTPVGILSLSTAISTLPLALVIIEDIGISLYKHGFSRNLISQKVWSYIKLVSPAFLTFFYYHLLKGTLINFTKDEIKKWDKNIDLSGHAFITCVNAYSYFQILKNIQTLGIKSNLYHTYLIVNSLVEGVWAFDTTVNHHSTKDMAAGCAMAGIIVGWTYMVKYVALFLFNTGHSWFKTPPKTNC